MGEFTTNREYLSLHYLILLWIKIMQTRLIPLTLGHISLWSPRANRNVTARNHGNPTYKTIFAKAPHTRGKYTLIVWSLIARSVCAKCCIVITTTLDPINHQEGCRTRYNIFFWCGFLCAGLASSHPEEFGITVETQVHMIYSVTMKAHAFKERS